jgi:hypothetical protein
MPHSPTFPWVCFELCARELELEAEAKGCIGSERRIVHAAIAVAVHALKRVPLWVIDLGASNQFSCF